MKFGRDGTRRHSTCLSPVDILRHIRMDIGYWQKLSGIVRLRERECFYAVPNLYGCLACQVLRETGK
jgi:hypothetical protein